MVGRRLQVKAPALTTHLERLGPFDPGAMSEREARAERRAFYVGENGYSSPPKLLTLPESQHKLGMSKRRSVGLSLAVASTSGDWNTCLWSTPGCRAVCVLLTAGKGTFPSVREGRELKTRFLAEHPQAFVTLLAAELRAQVARFGPIDFRPNVASDLRWERIAPALLHIRGVRVYDYTKAPAGQRDIVANYPLTFSVSELEHSVEEALEHLRSGTNAAVVFDTVKGHALPATWNGFKVVDGDKGDSRRDDPRSVVVGLRAKGDARGGESTGFVKEGVAS
jgi:hypothetical protein